MPSPHQTGSHTDAYEPSAYADEFDEDPARFLSFNKRLAIARIRGVTDPALLRAYADVEADRDARTDIIALINRRLSDLEETPK